MALKNYLSRLDPAARHAFALRCGASKGHLLNVASGYRTASPDLAVAIERESVGEVAAEAVLAATWTRVADSSWPNVAGRPCFDPGQVQAVAEPLAAEVQ
ncbi:MAG: hypothetical protein EON54_22410 [Alcaligenaceae bacterium]|nr:MAG: hypothetical protein EON54_22410 [Alcaligenaceae bacterium]